MHTSPDTPGLRGRASAHSTGSWQAHGDVVHPLAVGVSASDDGAVEGESGDGAVDRHPKVDLVVARDAEPPHQDARQVIEGDRARRVRQLAVLAAAMAGRLAP